MKKKIIAILLCNITLTYAATNPETNLILPHNPAPQSFQQAAPLPTLSNTNTSNTATPLTAKPTIPSPSANNQILTRQLHLLIHAFKKERKNTQQNFSDLNQKLATTGQVALDFQQKTAEQIVELSQENQSLKQQIHSLVGIMQTLNAEIAKTTGSNSTTIWLFSLAGFDVILFVLVLIALLSRRKNAGKTAKKSELQDDEYDFLGSKEGVNTRLDLARVYFEMDHFAEAEAILKTVLEDGNDEQKAEAKKLLAELQR